MSPPDETTATADFVPTARTAPPAVAYADIEIAAPPELPRQVNSRLLARLIPAIMAVAMAGMTAMLYRSGSFSPRNPMLLLFPAMMLVSAGVAAVSGQGGHGGADIDTDRRAYLDYLSGLRKSVINVAAAQRASLMWCHPDPAALWSVVGGERMWERRGDDPDFGAVRVGTGTQRLAARVVAPQAGPADRADPVTARAVRRFLDTHSTVADVPIAVALQKVAAVTVDGEPDEARGLLRAMICQLAVWHGPGRLLIAAATGDRYRDDWDWLKWLPHHQHPTAADGVGSARMFYPDLARGEAALAELLSGRAPRHQQPSDRPVEPQLVVVLDGDVLDGSERSIIGGGIAGVTVVGIGAACRGLASAAGLRLRVDPTELTMRPDEDGVIIRPDFLNSAEALVCARRLAGYRAFDTAGSGQAPGWVDLVGIDDPAEFDPAAAWGSRNRYDRLRVPVGTTPDGAAAEIDIKEAAEGGMGPHGLCVGATGSGKSELLRTIALGMVTRHSPDELNLVLVDFKGGATFLGLERARHVAAVITNLADEAPLVARMRDALAGEMTRRQELLRSAGNFAGVGAYEVARRAGAPLSALPALLIIVDEFSELLSQHPDFVDMFVAIGRLGRSLGMHLLLASQRLDEGKLRGLDSHLSYRICLKTLSASESRIVLGVPDGYELPNTPGAGYLRAAGGELTRFQTTSVSGPYPRPHANPTDATGHEPPAARLFTAAPVEPVDRLGPMNTESHETVLQTLLNRLDGHGPPARQVWLPPLAAAPTLDTLLGEDCLPGSLTVPIGVVDRPFEQRRTSLQLDLSGAAGHIAVIGAPQSGKSTALCTLITALAAKHDPGRVQLYCLDFGGGTLESVRPLPHVGALAGRAEPELVNRIIAELESIIGSREARFRALKIGSMAQYRRVQAERHPGCDKDRFGDVFLIIDGWASLRHDFETLEAPITALAARGLSFGVHVAVSAARWAEIRPALKDQLGTRIELRLGDAADSEINRRCAQQVPSCTPGRGLSPDGLHMIIALPRLDSAVSDTDPVHAAVGTGELLRRRYGNRAVAPVRLLPARVDGQAVIEAAGDDLRTGILIGLEERELAPTALDFSQQPHLLVLGDNVCGKTTALRTLCREIVRTATGSSAQIIIVDYRRTLLDAVDSDHLGGYAMSAAALTTVLSGLLELLQRRMPGAEITQQQLRARSWWCGPQIYLIVDDYDLVATASGNPLTPILEFLPHAADLGLHVVVARRTGGAARALFEPLLAGLRDLGCMGLMMSGKPDDGTLIGASRPVPLPPGRGTLSTRAGEQRIQVSWSPPT
jgi:S-DNA-T family DNA segregation ATPase FtsK/SpoIIIE